MFACRESCMCVYVCVCVCGYVWVCVCVYIYEDKALKGVSKFFETRRYLCV